MGHARTTLGERTPDKKTCHPEAFPRLDFQSDWGVATTAHSSYRRLCQGGALEFLFRPLPMQSGRGLAVSMGPQSTIRRRAAEQL